MQLPRAWAEIRLQAVVENFCLLRDHLRKTHAAKTQEQHCKDGEHQKSEAPEIIAVLKADAYGLGAKQIAEALEQAGCTMIGVGDSHEAISLRQSGVKCAILILGAVVESEIADLIAHKITPTIHSPDRIRSFQAHAQKQGIKLPVHLLVDTGMSRLGVASTSVLEHVQNIRAAENLELQGIGSHFADGANQEFSQQQIQDFQKVVAELQANDIDVPLKHLCSSIAVFKYPQAHYDAVRVGGMLLGLTPTPPLEGIDSALSLYAQVVYLRDIAAGQSVSYGCEYRCSRPTRVATLALGYHDGYRSQLGNRAQVLVRSKRAPVIGRVTMDYTMIDVTDIPGVAVGDRVTLLGRQGDEEITALELAKWASGPENTPVPYEIPCQLGSRVRKIWLGPYGLPERFLPKPN